MYNYIKSQNRKQTQNKRKLNHLPKRKKMPVETLKFQAGLGYILPPLIVMQNNWAV